MTDITFSVNLHDNVGDAFEEGIYLHFGQSTIIRLENMEDLTHVIDTLKRIVVEIEENY